MNAVQHLDDLDRLRNVFIQRLSKRTGTIIRSEPLCCSERSEDCRIPHREMKLFRRKAFLGNASETQDNSKFFVFFSSQRNRTTGSGVIDFFHSWITVDCCPLLEAKFSGLPTRTDSLFVVPGYSPGAASLLDLIILVFVIERRPAGLKRSLLFRAQSASRVYSRMRHIVYELSIASQVVAG